MIEWFPLNHSFLEIPVWNVLRIVVDVLWICVLFASGKNQFRVFGNSLGRNIFCVHSSVIQNYHHYCMSRNN